MAGDFSQFLIKKYKYWVVYIHENQGYLGRCVIWCGRDNALDLAETTTEEQKELFVVLQNLKEAASKAFAPDWFNYVFLGNEIRHLHGHFVPRYKKPREFMGIVFKDKYWGRHYKTDKDFKIPDSVIFSIRDKIKNCFK